MYNKDDKLKVKCTTKSGHISIAELTVIDFEEQHFCGYFWPGYIDGHDIMFWFGEFLVSGECEGLKFEVEKMNIFTRLYDGVQTRFVLTGVCAETKSDYWYSRNEILDPRPINEICAILFEFYSDPKEAVKLLKQGNILHLSNKFRECKFTGEPVCSNAKPTPSTIETYNIHDGKNEAIFERRIQFIRFSDVWGWSNKLLGDFKALHDEHVKAQPSQITMF